jgi:hypothetical protein
LMFSIFGILITGYGLMTISNTEMYQKSLNINVNIAMGAVMLIFGLFMLYFARRKKHKKQ